MRDWFARKNRSVRPRKLQPVRNAEYDARHPYQNMLCTSQKHMNRKDAQAETQPNKVRSNGYGYISARHCYRPQDTTMVLHCRNRAIRSCTCPTYLARIVDIRTDHNFLCGDSCSCESCIYDCDSLTDAGIGSCRRGYLVQSHGNFAECVRRK